MIDFYKPKLEELSYRESLLADKETMSYNEKWGGTIDWSKEKWAAWAKKWLNSDEKQFFYRYIQSKDNGGFVGEAAFRFDEEYGMHVISIIVEAKHRGKGYGRAALLKLIDTAKLMRISCLCDDIAVNNLSIGLFLSAGFTEKWKNDDVVMLVKELEEA